MILNRRRFLASTTLAPALAQRPPNEKNRKPNVVLVLTDDQGFGDLSLHGNPHLKTPNMDRAGLEGVQFTQFQVCPVCSPTRSSLLTGRYNYRTGVVDTFLGRSLMYPEEVTVAEILRDNGYRTGIFGKWHLGDNYPMRAMDQGFQEALVHRGGGIGQSSDPPGSSYFDPILQHNGAQKQYKGYCTDVFFGEAMNWIEAAGDRPFFAYIAPNAPHVPLMIAEEWVEPFRKRGLSEETAKVYGMVANADKNLGLLLDKLRELKIERDTLLIFMTDNGPTPARFNSGMRGLKGTTYQGGIRVPFFVRWPGRLQPGKTDRAAAQIDVLPTLLDFCGIAKPENPRIDGRSLRPLAEGTATGWTDRMLFTQWHRGDRPEPFKNSAVRTQRFKLVNGTELYDLENDPGESKDLSAAQPETVARLRKGYTDWFEDVSSPRHFEPSRIYLGTPHENPVTLTPQDWRVPPDAPQAPGWWEVDVRTAGAYEVTMRFDPLPAVAKAAVRFGSVSSSMEIGKGAGECRFPPMVLPAGRGQFRGEIEAGGRAMKAKLVDVRLLEKQR